MANVNKWSRTIGSNGSADSDINFVEGQAPNTVNNSARALMQGVANDRDDTRGQLVSAGSTTAYTVTTNSINPTLQNGLEVAFRVNATSTGSVTLNVDGTGTKKVFDNGTSAGVQLVAGGLTANEKCVVQYETTADSGNGGWVRVSNGGTANTSGFKTTTGGSYAAEVTVASAATTDILGASADFVAISGTATITSLGSGANKLRVVRATGAFTLTHNATSLILPGAANRTFAAGDMFLVSSDVSSNARVFDISTADARSIKAFTGDSGSGGAIGLVPAPATGDAAAVKWLNSDGTWKAIPAATLLGAGVPDIMLEEQQPSGTNGGTFTLGADRTRVLNTEVRDARGECALASNQFTLTAGTYWIEASAPAFTCQNHQAVLYNVTGTADLIVGTPEQCPTNSQTRSYISGAFTVAAAQALEIRHRCTVTRATDGLGSAAGYSRLERYTTVRLWRIS